MAWKGQAVRLITTLFFTNKHSNTLSNTCKLRCRQVEQQWRAWHTDRSISLNCMWVGKERSSHLNSPHYTSTPLLFSIHASSDAGRLRCRQAQEQQWRVWHTDCSISSLYTFYHSNTTWHTHTFIIGQTRLAHLAHRMQQLQLVHLHLSNTTWHTHTHV